MPGDPDSEKTVIQRVESPEGSGSGSAYVIVLSGRSIGRMFRLDVGTHVIGRSSQAEIQLDDDGVSRNHARLVHREDGKVQIEDLRSTNGTWINNERVTVHELSDGDRIRVGSVTILKFSYQGGIEERLQAQLYESVTRDSLTSAFNKRYFEEHLSKAHSHSVRHRQPLSLIVLDVDHFKQVNDTLGHPCGDRILASVGTLLSAAVRNEDVFCRIGGEEFAIIMRECPEEASVLLGERLRALVAASAFDCGGTPVPITISLGVATLGEHHPTPEALYEEADQALYRAKRSGRNRVCRVE